MNFDRLLSENSLNGIYIIWCSVTGDYYIGQCGRKGGFKARWDDHARRLAKGHTSPHLRNAYLKYGAETFYAWVLEILPADKALLTEREQVYVDELKPAYNMLQECVSSPLGVPRSPETRAKIAASSRGKKMSPEALMRMSASQKGKPRSPEMRAKLSLLRMGVRKSLETRARMSLAAYKREAAKRHG